MCIQSLLWYSMTTFWSYLWGIEICKQFFRRWIIFSFDLTYEGLKFGIVNRFILCWLWVLILPMRDWNLSDVTTPPTLPPVLILPMRDWNTRSFLFYLNRVVFWSYLWGIEISVKCTKRSFSYPVLILPMRDWNGKLRHRLCRIVYAFWSYLWGIEILFTSGGAERTGGSFDLTYEGLKWG